MALLRKCLQEVRVKYRDWKPYEADWPDSPPAAKAAEAEHRKYTGPRSASVRTEAS